MLGLFKCDKRGITEEVGVVTTDTAANMIKMMEYLPIHSLRGGCINHVIQLTINDDIPERLPRIIPGILGFKRKFLD